MAHINRKYIDSHWLTFMIRGIVAILFGWITLFHSDSNFPTIITYAGLFLLLLSVIEFINALHRARNQTGWLVSVLVAVLDTVAALLLLLTSNAEITFDLIVLSSYVIIRSVAQIIIGFRTTIDPTDRFIWVITGICGTIMGFAILNSGALGINFFVRFFGAYLLITGMSSMIYGFDNRQQKLEDHAARVEAAKTRKKSAKKTTKKK